MITVNVLLAGGLNSYGPRSGHPTNDDGTYRLSMREGSMVSELLDEMRLPGEEVAMTARNGRACGRGERLGSGDRVVLVHRNAVGMWRMLGRWNKGMESAFNFGAPDNPERVEQAA